MSKRLVGPIRIWVRRAGEKSEQNWMGTLEWGTTCTNTEGLHFHASTASPLHQSLCSVPATDNGDTEYTVLPPQVIKSWQRQVYFLENPVRYLRNPNPVLGGKASVEVNVKRKKEMVGHLECVWKRPSLTPSTLVGNLRFSHKPTSFS